MNHTNGVKMYKAQYIQVYTCYLGGWLDSDMKINFHSMTLIWEP